MLLQYVSLFDIMLLAAAAGYLIAALVRVPFALGYTPRVVMLCFKAYDYLQVLAVADQNISSVTEHTEMLRLLLAGWTALGSVLHSGGSWFREEPPKPRALVSGV